MFWAKKFLEEILTYISENNFSDLHLTSGRKARIRNRIGDLEEIEKIKAMDMFPHTHHIETVVSLIKEKS